MGQEQEINNFYFETLVQNSPDMIIHYNDQLEVIFFNHEVKKIPGVENALIHDRTTPDPAEAPPKRDMQTNLKDRNWALQKCLDTGEKLTIDEYLFQGIDARHYHFSTRFFPEVDTESGKIKSILAVSKNITVRRHDEKRGAIIRELLTGIVDMVDLKDALLFCLDKALLATNFDSGGIYIREGDRGPLKLAVHRGLSQSFIKKVSLIKPESPAMNLVLSGQPIYEEYYNLGVPIDEARRKEGLKAIAVLPIFHSQRCVACLNLASHTTTEITEVDRETVETIIAQIGGSIARIRAEEALWESNEFIDKIMTSLPDVIIYIFDLTKKRNVYVSSSIERVLGYSADEMQSMGTKVLDKTIHPDDLQPFYDHLAELEKLGERHVKHFEYRMKHRDGHWVWLENRDTVFSYDKTGKPLQTIGTVVEIQGRKESK